MKTPIKIGLGVMTLALVGGTALAASAHDLPENENRPAWATKLHEAMESGDYAAWKTAQTERFQEQTSEARFNDLKEFHRLMSEGKRDEAFTYAKEHDLRMGFGHGRGHGQHMRSGSDDTSENS